jgi:hypothetical protein
MQGETLRNQLLAAMRHFDTDLRLRYWSSWERQTVDREAIAYNGRWYPVRFIAELATKSINVPYTTLKSMVNEAGLQLVGIKRGAKNSRKWRAKPLVSSRTRTGTVRQQPEHEFEQQVIIPLLQCWNLRYDQQVYCTIRKAGEQRRAFIDFLVYAENNQAMLTLFENKSRLRTEAERERAAAQANAYARARRLPSFVLAAPEGLWVYQRAGGKLILKHTFSSAEVRDGAPDARRLLIELRQRGRSLSSPVG